jgi:hypothetical protein
MASIKDDIKQDQRKLEAMGIYENPSEPKIIAPE